MQISIVMTTYNGSRYIKDQLQSLYMQECLADEVIILDDCSTDNTVEIVEQFINENRLDNWNIKTNSKNVGWKQNFINGFQYAKGDLIFPCDQDDIWYKDKLKVMSEVMEQHPEISLLVGKAKYLFMDIPKLSASRIDRYKISQFIDKRKRQKKGANTKKIKPQKFNHKFKTVAQGCLMCFRHDFWKKIEGYWSSDLAHDSFLAFYAKLMGKYYVLDYDVMYYRYHIGSASTPIKRNRASRLKELQIDAKEIENIKEHFPQTSAGESEFKILRQAIQWNTKRIHFVKNRKYWYGIQLLALLPYYTKFRRYLTDWIYALKGK